MQKVCLKYSVIDSLKYTNVFIKYFSQQLLICCYYVNSNSNLISINMPLVVEDFGRYVYTRSKNILPFIHNINITN